MIKLFFLVTSTFDYNNFFKKYITDNIKKIFIYYLVVDYSQKILFTAENNLTNVYFCSIYVTYYLYLLHQRRIENSKKKSNCPFIYLIILQEQ